MVKIREALWDDMAQIIDLCQLHSEYEKQAYDKSGKLEGLGKVLFDKEIPVWCYVADNNGIIEGYATATREFSTWDTQYYLHMDCLFVLENTRGKGLGKKLMKAIEALSLRLDNDKAIHFYQKYGAINKKKMRFFLEAQREHE